MSSLFLRMALLHETGKLGKQLKSLYDLQLITKLRSNMKNQLLPMADKRLLRKRALIETIIDQLKNIAQIEHTRHRSPVNFMVHLIGGLIAYCHQPKKPALTSDGRLQLEAA